MKVLFVEDDEDFSSTIVAEPAFGDAEIQFWVCSSTREAKELLNSEAFDLVVCDLEIPADPGGDDRQLEYGKEVCTEARRVVPGTPLLVLSGRGTLEVAVDLFRTPAPQ